MGTPLPDMIFQPFHPIPMPTAGFVKMVFV